MNWTRILWLLTELRVSFDMFYLNMIFRKDEAKYKLQKIPESITKKKKIKIKIL